MKGHELAAIRKAAGFTQTELAEIAGIGRHAVSYWERKETVDLRSWAIGRMRKHLRLPHFLTTTRPRVMESWLKEAHNPSWTEAWLLKQKIAQASVRVSCGARTRQGTPCKAKSVKGKKRCKLHGGLSTGPRTKEGKQAISTAQKNRWK